MSAFLGKHLIVELYKCDSQIISSTQKVEELMKSAAIESGASIVSSEFHTFSPHGVSGVIIIKESHLTIHCWPEYGYASVDIYTCGDTVDPWKALAVLKRGFKAESMDSSLLSRGDKKMFKSFK